MKKTRREIRVEKATFNTLTLVSIGMSVMFMSDAVHPWLEGGTQSISLLMMIVCMLLTMVCIMKVSSIDDYLTITTLKMRVEYDKLTTTDWDNVGLSYKDAIEINERIDYLKEELDID